MFFLSHEILGVEQCNLFFTCKLNRITFLTALLPSISCDKKTYIIDCILQFETGPCHLSASTLTASATAIVLPAVCAIRSQKDKFVKKPRRTTRDNLMVAQTWTGG